MILHCQFDSTRLIVGQTFKSSYMDWIIVKTIQNDEIGMDLIYLDKSNITDDDLRRKGLGEEQDANTQRACNLIAVVMFASYMV